MTDYLTIGSCHLHPNTFIGTEHCRISVDFTQLFTGCHFLAFFCLAQFVVLPLEFSEHFGLHLASIVLVQFDPCYHPHLLSLRQSWCPIAWNVALWMSIQIWSDRTQCTQPFHHRLLLHYSHLFWLGVPLEKFPIVQDSSLFKVVYSLK